MAGARGLVVIGCVALTALLPSLGVAVVSPLLSSASSDSPGAVVVDGIPRDYLQAYVAAADAFSLGEEGWSILAGIGKVESDHGRSTAAGVRSGQNFHGCCAGPMQFHNGFGTGGGTWGAYGVDGNDDGVRDIYDIVDAAPSAARYLRASGAPSDWPAALFAYNHDHAYVAKVLATAEQYRTNARVQEPEMGTSVGASDGWLADVPGFPGERCDVRIVADVVALVREYGLHLSDCYGGAPHAANGEHPLGLAIDVSPADGDWSRTMRLARAAGWQPSCAASGCGGRGPFRVVLYNGFPGHGDPAHTGTPHLHLSWDHAPAAPFSRASWVRVLIARPSLVRP